MSIRPIGDPFPLSPDREAIRPGGETAAARRGAREVAPESSDVRPLDEKQWEELRDQAQQAGVEVRLQILPHTGVVNIQFVEPGTGKVVREFPPERLVEALAAMRARFSRHIDRQA